MKDELEDEMGAGIDGGDFGYRPPLHLRMQNVSGEPTGLKEGYQKFWRCLSAVADSNGPAAHLQNFSLRVLDPDRPATQTLRIRRWRG